MSAMVQQCPSNSKDRKLCISKEEAESLGDVQCSDRLGLEDLGDFCENIVRFLLRAIHHSLY